MLGVETQPEPAEAAPAEEAAPEPRRIEQVRSIAERDALLLSVGDGCLVLAMLGAADTPPVLNARKFLSNCAERLPLVTFAVVDSAGEATDMLFEACQISTLPTFQVSWLGETIGEFSGADELKLLTELSRVQAAVHPVSVAEMTRPM